MTLRVALLTALLAVTSSASGEETVVNFEKAVVLLPDGKANRIPNWEEKGVTFSLAHQPQTTKGKGLLMFFSHLPDGHKGLVCAMATEPIPVRATFAKPVLSVSVSMWGSTGVPAVLQAFDSDGKVVDRATIESAPARKAPADPMPVFTITVKASRIAYVEWSGPREGEYLAAEELRFTPAEHDASQ
jgi:hypothetical protein